MRAIIFFGCFLIVASSAWAQFGEDRWQRGAPKKPSPWIAELLTRRPTNVVLVAMANKTARIVWAMMRDQQPFTAEVR